jgi:hypothetical protein
MPLNLPILLTWLRIVLIPLFVGIFYFEKSWVSEPNQNLVATVIFTVAALTDWLDGWLARKLDQTSAFGEFLDPVADKLMVAAALITLVQLGRVDAIIALVIIGREIAISALREWMAKIGASRSVGGILPREDQDDIADDRDPVAALLRSGRDPESPVAGHLAHLDCRGADARVDGVLSQSRHASRVEAGCLSRHH